MKDYSSITRPYPVFDRAGRDLAPQILENLFGMSIVDIRRHLRSYHRHLLVWLDLSGTQRTVTDWLKMLETVGNRVATDKAIKPWYAEHRALIDAQPSFVALDYVWVFSRALAWEPEIAERDGADLLRLGNVILDVLPVPPGLDIRDGLRVWYAERLRRAMLDVMKRELGRVGKVDFQPGAEGGSIGDAALDQTIAAPGGNSFHRL